MGRPWVVIDGCPAATHEVWVCSVLPRVQRLFVSFLKYSDSLYLPSAVVPSMSFRQGVEKLAWNHIVEAKA